MTTLEEHPTSPYQILNALEHLIFFFISNFAHPTPSPPYLPHPHSTRKNLPSLRIAYLASLSHTTIHEARILTKRDVYYICRPLFPNPASVDRALAALAAALNLPRNHLNIVAAPKGIVTGRVAFVDEHGHAIDLSLFAADGCLVPPRPERITDLTTDACAVVV